VKDLVWGVFSDPLEAEKMPASSKGQHLVPTRAVMEHSIVTIAPMKLLRSYFSMALSARAIFTPLSVSALGPGPEEPEAVVLPPSPKSSSGAGPQSTQSSNSTSCGGGCLPAVTGMF
jgi:hypothetical protein